MDKKIVFSVDELSDYLHVSKSSIRKMVRTKEIPFFRILSRIFFDKEIRVSKPILVVKILSLLVRENKWGFFDFLT